MAVRLAAALAALSLSAASAAPCDIFAAAGTPCVCAHSVVRALYAAYNGPLYLLRRASDSYTAVVATAAAGGFANVATQAAFCAGTSCVIWRIFDQSPFANDLSIAPPGGWVPRIDNGVNASRWPVSVGGHKVFGAYFEGAMGYRIDATNSVATGNEAETLYMVTSGTHVNGGECAQRSAHSREPACGRAHKHAWTRAPPFSLCIRLTRYRPVLFRTGCCFDCEGARLRREQPLPPSFRVPAPRLTSLRRRCARRRQRRGRQPRRRGGHDGGRVLRQRDDVGQGAGFGAVGHG